jgi:hypothetical protein
VRTVIAVPAMTPIQRLIVALVQYENSVTVCVLVDSSLTTRSSRTTPHRLGTLCREALATLNALHS